MLPFLLAPTSYSPLTTHTPLLPIPHCPFPNHSLLTTHFSLPILLKISWSEKSKKKIW